MTIIFLLATFTMLPAQTISPFNKLAVKDPSAAYSFLVSGHFYGSSTNISSFPASTLLANLDTLNALDPSFIMSLGDLFQDVNDSYIENYERCLFSKLKAPLFNSVGDHDLSNGNIYEKVYGKTFFSFAVRSELYIVLNTELNDGSIKDEQLELFKNAVKQASSADVKNVFIFSHRPVWAERIEKYSQLFKGNTRTKFGKNNFSEEIQPLIKTLSASKNVYWISGSMGGGPASFFYDKNEELNATFIITSLRDLSRDAVLQVNVNNASVTFKAIAFANETILPVEQYNMEYWNKTVAPESKFSFRMLPYLTMQMISHRYFWIGFAVALVMIYILAFFRKRWKRNN